MPKSKRDKKVSLTKTSKKGLALKQNVVRDVKNCVERFNNIFLIYIHNMRNNKLKDLHSQWKDSRFFFGKNKVVALGLGRTPETEAAEGVHKLANALKGQCGLLFTNKSKTEVVEWTKEFGLPEYARSGFIATKTIVLQPGPLEDFSHSIEPHLRKLGMPTMLQRGVVTLTESFTVCKVGQTLTPEQASILKLLQMPLADFRISALGVYRKNKGYKKLMKRSDLRKDSTQEMEVEQTVESKEAKQAEESTELE